MPQEALFVLSYIAFRFFFIPTGIQMHYAYILLCELCFLLILLHWGRKTSLRLYMYVWKKEAFQLYFLGTIYALLLLCVSFLFFFFFPVQNEVQISPHLYLAIPLLLLTSLMEELLFRNYLVKLGLRLGIPLSLSVVLSSLLFAFGHGYQGFHAILFSFSSGMLLCMLMIRYQSIVICITCHGLYNIVLYSFTYST